MLQSKMDYRYFQDLARIYEDIYRGYRYSMLDHLGEHQAEKWYKASMRQASDWLVEVRGITSAAKVIACQAGYIANLGTATKRKGVNGLLNYEHVVPVSLIHNKMAKEMSLAERTTLVKEHLFMVLCTAEEHTLLNSKFAKEMPADWDWLGDSLARYNHFSIQVEQYNLDLEIR